MLRIPDKERESWFADLKPNQVSEPEKYFIWYNLTWEEADEAIKFSKEVDQSKLASEAKNII